MCNAYAMKIPVSTLTDAFAQLRIPLIFPEGAPNAEPTDAVRPTDPAPLIRNAGEGQAALVAMRWGLPPSAPKRPLLINMRAEGRSFPRGRALVPASWFYEYTGTKYPKTRWAIAPADADWITFAALWRETDQGPRFTLLTVDAGPDIVPVHGRQPAVVTPADRAAWLDERGPPPPLAPSPAGAFTVSQG
jgi:putative SOS response-associated peptidase YedK